MNARLPACPSLLLAALTLLVLSADPHLHAQAAPSAQPSITYQFERPGFVIPKFTLVIYRSGDGSYTGDQVGEPVRGTPTQPEVGSFDRRFTLAPATADKVFSFAQQLNHFKTRCASNAKNIADTGTRTFTYSGPGGPGACTFKFTENRDLEQLNIFLQGITETMDRGRELDRLHRYDRLGLDAAMEFLTKEVSDGTALDLGTIAPTLRSLAADPEVLKRVRDRANALLATIPPTP